MAKAMVDDFIDQVDDNESEADYDLIWGEII